jgi:hypothetical protein
MQRRRLLAALPATLSLAAGCLAGPDDRWPAPAGASGDATPASPTPQEPVRGGSDADVSVRVVEDDEDVTYRPEDDAVRFVAGWRRPEDTDDGTARGTREPVYETTPFEDWARTQCASAGARAAADHAAAELGVEDVGSGVSNDVPDHDLAATVSTTTILDRDGEVVSEAAVEFGALVDAAPGSVDATYILEGNEYATAVPVYVQHRVLRQQ